MKMSTLSSIWAFMVTVLPITHSSNALAAELIDHQRLELLLGLRFPPPLSRIQCHGTAMAVTDVLSLPLSLSLNEPYFSGTCFKKVSDPQTGDYGMFVIESVHAVLHTFTVVNEHQIFQKANPGWDENPWELISVNSMADVRSHFTNYLDAELRWARYAPSPDCTLKQAQDWINANRADPTWGPFIADQEGYLSGKRPTSTAAQYFAVLSAMDRLNPDAPASSEASVTDVILHALHEYFIRPEFKPLWAPFLTKRKARYQEVLGALNKAVQNVIPESLFAEAMVHATPTFSFNNIAIFDNSRSGYLILPEPYPFPDLKSFDVGTFNRAQDEFRIEMKSTGYGSIFHVRLKGDSEVWSFQFSR